MPVFISYRHTDRVKALDVYQQLEDNGILCYLDVIDEESKTTTDITDVITKNIKRCTHLLAIISSNTSGSWWVPFEIGEATVLNRRICSYAFRENDSLSRYFMSSYNNILPEYLQKWPVLLSSSDIDKFIQQYKLDKKYSFVMENFRDFRDESLTKSGADSFHKTLKNIL